MNTFPVHFSLVVSNKRIGANLETILYSDTNRLYSISFADGFHDCFFFDRTGQIASINETQGRHYATGLKHELKVFSLLGNNSHLENFPYEVEGEFANGWIIKEQGTTGLTYTIYLKGIYQFEIVEKENGWTALLKDKPGLAPIDTKLAQYAFAWANTPVPEKPVMELQEEVAVSAPIEFLLPFQYNSEEHHAHAILLDMRPWQQCTIAVKTGDINAPLTRFDFFKVGNKNQVFTWLPYEGTKEKMAKSIARALEEKFNVKKLFAVN